MYMAAGVEFLRVEALPPLALAVGLGEGVGVVADACERALGVVVVGDLQPVPCVGGVVGDGEAQAVLAGELAVDADDVLLRADLDGVPVVETGVVGVEVVVVVGERGEVLCAGGDVEIHQLFGLPVLGLPEVVDLHEAELGGMAVGGDVVVVLRLPWMYMLRAYQSPCSGTHCADQWFHMPNLASRNQSGVVQAVSDSHVGLKGPGAMWTGWCGPWGTGAACASRLRAENLEARAAAGAAARAD
jgi:hypothetical protein